jgi:DNA-binding NarL/FixJ family response regulator
MGRVIAQRYEMRTEIGAGGMGTVYHGFDQRLQAPVAIKHLRRVLNQPEQLSRFIREGEVLHNLNHPNIVKILDTVQEGDDYYLILEYLPGGDLAALLQRGRLPIDWILNVGMDIADALTRAHRLNIVHRDLKPANVLLAEDGTPRLTDFGIAHLESADRLTGTGAVIGTPAYLSPEALGGGSVEAGMDIWSFGVMLFEMVTGRLPFKGVTSSQMITSILFEQVPEIEALRPDCPPGLTDLIYRMLEKEPGARISSIRLVGAELEAVRADADRVPAQRPEKPMINIFVVDDHEIFRNGLRLLIDSTDDMTLIGEAESGADVLEKLAGLQPDLILMDIHMPGENGIDVTRRIKQHYPDMTVLMLTMFEDDKSVFAAMQAGASGYILKGIKHNEMLQILRMAAAGGAVFSPRIAGYIMQYFAHMETAQPASAVELPKLSGQEQDVLALIAAGDDNPTIAEKLTLPPRTVWNYVSQVLKKLTVSDRIAAEKARQSGMK